MGKELQVGVLSLHEALLQLRLHMQPHCSLWWLEIAIPMGKRLLHPLLLQPMFLQSLLLAQLWSLWMACQTPSLALQFI